MPAYTFHGLSDADFEDLACDLLASALGFSLQTFTKGRDSGIDMLHGTRMHGSTVVQCKHYAGSNFAKLRASVAAEGSKLERLRPSRYVLATSLGLTPKNKELLRDAVAPYCKGIDDIIGRDDLNALLRAHPQVETTHHKLWLTSSAVLQLILRNGSAIWNALTKEDIAQKMSLYVQTSAYGRAMEILTKDHYCVLSGIPGIGKTTLAQIITARLLADGWHLIAVRNDIEEAFHALDPMRKQVVFYDDFLGQSSIGERLAKNEDRSIVRLLDAARRSDRLKVVLTTREYILEDAKRMYEPLSRGGLDIAKCTVKVEDYTRGLRARILYNHVFFSALSSAYAAALLRDKGYRRIVDHPSFSPRIVEWMTIGSAHLGLRADSYVDDFIRVLSNPSALWEHAFDNQIDHDSRLILYAVSTLDGSISLDDLKHGWGAMRSDIGDITQHHHLFRAAVKQLDGSFLKSVRARNGEIALEFHNPSIKDFVRNRVAADPALRTELLCKSVFFEQIRTLVRLSAAGKIEAVPRGLVPADDRLYAALSRTLHAATPIRHLARTAYNGAQFERPVVNVGRRFSEAASWSTSLGSSGLLPALAVMAEAQIGTDAFGQIATAAACPFVSLLLSSNHQGQYENLTRLLIQHIAESIDGGSSVDEWIDWTRFVKEHPEAFSSEEMDTWAEEAARYCFDEVDAIIEHTNSSDEADQWFSQVEELAQAWSVSLDSKREDFDDHVKKFGDPDGPEDSGSWRWGGSEETSDGDAQIDRLFESLSDREK